MIDRIKERLMARMAGTSRAGEPMISPPGMTITPFGTTPREMDYVGSSDQVRDRVLAIYGIPKVLAGLTNDVNRASIEGAMVIFCENVLNPTLSMFAGFLTERLARRFDSDLVVWFPDCKPRDAEQERAEAELDWKLGAVSPDERRRDRGREPWGVASVSDTGYLPTSVTPMVEAPAPDAGGDSPDGEPDAAPVDGEDEPGEN